MVVVLVFWFWSPLIKYNIMCLQEMVCRSVDHFVPAAFREIGINKHGVHFVKEGVVYALCYTILLWGVGHCYLMFDPFLLKVLLGVGAGVFTSPISSKCRHLGAS